MLPLIQLVTVSSSSNTVQPGPSSVATQFVLQYKGAVLLLAATFLYVLVLYFVVTAFTHFQSVCISLASILMKHSLLA